MRTRHSEMKVHQFARGLWEHEPSLTLARKHLNPLPPKLQPDPNTITLATFDLKSFIETESASKKLGSTDDNRDSAQVEMQPGGTRWNPTQEQISILEMLYRGGMRTPNAQQIEQITVQLGKYGKIEGKNVFYWFQNHKARERQKQKRNIPCLNQSPRAARPVTSSVLVTHDIKSFQEIQRKVLYGHTGNEEDIILKRKCRTWTFECLDEEDKRYRREEGDRTLLLFPLHPEN